MPISRKGRHYRGNANYQTLLLQREERHEHSVMVGIAVKLTTATRGVDDMVTVSSASFGGKQELRNARQRWLQLLLPSDIG